MKLPNSFIAQMQALLGEEAPAFFDALQIQSPTSIRLNPDKPTVNPSQDTVRWSSMGYYLPERPIFTLDPFFHAGAYYVQEAASMFVEQIVCQHLNTDKGLNVLDLCAAPGGKSTHLLSLLPENSILVTNEIIRSRANILDENICKWGYPNVVVTNNAPKDFARLKGFFDVILVDAPCSGEGMFRKDPDSVNEWSENNVALCSERQRKILADVWPSLKDGGLLLYSTCTYNRTENEQNAAWLSKELSASSQRILVEKDWGIVEVEEDGVYGYHFYPHRTKSEGFFLAALKKDEQATGNAKKPAVQQVKKLSKDFGYIQQLLSNQDSWDFSMFENRVKALPIGKLNGFRLLEQNLHIVHSGIELGEIKGKDFIPSPSLALSTHLSHNFYPVLDADLDIALNFLRRNTVSVNHSQKGYLLVCYKNHSLGWLKNLGNRTNNLYPNEWRIRNF